MDYKIQLDKIYSYLKAKGWEVTRFDDNLDLISIYVGDKKFSTVVPKSMKLVDYKYRVAEVIDVISKVEGRDGKNVARDIENLWYDVFKVRFKSAIINDGNIRLPYFVPAIEDVKKMLLYGACAEINDTRHKYGKPFGAAEELLSHCEVTQTERGSFIVGIRVPFGEIYLKKEDTRKRNKKEEIRDLGGLGRRTLIRLFNGIAEAENRKINESIYYDKLNKNVYDALTNILESKNSGIDVELNLHLNEVKPVEKKVKTEISIDAKHYFNKFKRISDRLSDLSKKEKHVLEGKVTTLHTEYKEDELLPGERTITIHVQKRNMKVHVLLSAEDHIRATQAYGQERMIRIEGVLIKKDNKWFLENYEDFKILGNKKLV